jgi:hypothetical protein
VAAAASVPAAVAAARALFNTFRRADRLARFRSRRTAAFRLDFFALAELGMLVSASDFDRTDARTNFGV